MFRFFLKMLSECGKCHFRDTNFKKFPRGPCPRPLLLDALYVNPAWGWHIRVTPLVVDRLATPVLTRTIPTKIKVFRKLSETSEPKFEQWPERVEVLGITALRCPRSLLYPYRLIVLLSLKCCALVNDYHISKTPVELPTFLFSGNYSSPRFAFQHQHLS